MHVRFKIYLIPLQNVSIVSIVSTVSFYTDTTRIPSNNDGTNANDGALSHGIMKLHIHLPTNDKANLIVNFFWMFCAVRMVHVCPVKLGRDVNVPQPHGINIRNEDRGMLFKQLGNVPLQYIVNLSLMKQRRRNNEHAILGREKECWLTVIVEERNAKGWQINKCMHRYLNLYTIERTRAYCTHIIIIIYVQLGCHCARNNSC